MANREVPVIYADGVDSVERVGGDVVKITYYALARPRDLQNNVEYRIIVASVIRPIDPNGQSAAAEWLRPH
jgi:hypothetical protein